MVPDSVTIDDVTIAVATFGDERWSETAGRVAVPSAVATGAWVIHCHSRCDSMHTARQACLDAVTTEWIINLDADDELEVGYLQAMMAASGDVRVPRVRYVTGQGRESAPVFPKVVWPEARHRRHRPCMGECLVDGNWVVIGAMARTQLLRDVGGWRDFAYEDWDMWLRCHLAGAGFEPVPGAVYRAHGRLTGRGLNGDAAAMLAAHRAVAEANGVATP